MKGPESQALGSVGPFFLGRLEAYPMWLLIPQRLNRIQFARPPGGIKAEKDADGGGEEEGDDGGWNGDGEGPFSATGEEIDQADEPPEANTPSRKPMTPPMQESSTASTRN